MNKKLTLLLDEAVINKTKEYAERNKETLSGLVEKYFRYVTSKTPTKTREKIHPEIEKLIGIISIPPDIDIKKDYRQHRADKASHE